MILAGFSPGWPVIVAGHVVVAIPWVVIVVGARLRTYDVELEAAARDLGAGPLQTLRRVTLPILAPAILGAALLAFAWSFDETLITTFTAGQETTVPLYIIARLRRTVDPTGNAVAIFLLLIPWLTFALAAIVLRRSGGVSAVMGQQ
jgi:spermidine/putrescine transport system permease protein